MSILPVCFSNSTKERAWSQVVACYILLHPSPQRREKFDVLVSMFSSTPERYTAKGQKEPVVYGPAPSS